MNAESPGSLRVARLYLVDRVDMQGLLQDLGWDRADDSWVLEGRGWSATVPNPVRVEWADLPEVVSERQVGVGWRIDARLEGAEAGLARLNRALKAIARVGHGVVLDGDGVWKPGPSRRLAPVPVKKESEFLTLTWWVESGRLSSQEGAEALVSVLNEILPEAVPYKWNRLPMDRVWVTDDTESLTECIAAPGITHFEVHSPFTGFTVTHCVWPPGDDHGVRWLNIRGLAIEVAASVLGQPGWGRHMSQAFRAVSDVLRPFYGEARLQQGEYVRNVRHIANPPPVAVQHWYGFPRSSPLAMVVGPPYRERWDLPGGEEAGSLLFYTSEAWPEPPSGGVPQAPESFLQEYDIRWKEVPARFPGLGAGVTGDHPSRQPGFWPFEETSPAIRTHDTGPPAFNLAGATVAGSPDGGTDELPTRHYEWPSLDLGGLPAGSWYKRVAPPVFDRDNAGRRPSWQEPTGETWTEWSRDFHETFEQEWARRPDPKVVPEGAEPASAMLDRLVRQVVAPALRARGLKGSGRTFYLSQGDQRAGIGLQKSVHNRKSLVEFTFNFYGLPPFMGGTWSRIGEVLPEMRDTWWVIPAGASTDRFEADLLESLVDYAVPFIQTATEDPALYDYMPADPQRSRDHRPPRRRPIFEIYPQPPTFEQLLSDALDGNPAHSSADRAAVIQHACWTGKGDRRCTPILMELLANEPDAPDRSTAALRLAFTDVDPEIISPAIAHAADQDPEPMVRLVARYALKLFDRRANPAT